MPQKIIYELKNHQYKTALKLTYSEIKGSFPMLLYLVWFLLMFRFIEKISRVSYSVVHARLDDMIPFIEVFIVPYMTWFGYLVLNMIFFYFFDKEVYHKSASMLYLGMTFFIILSLIWPNAQNLRPEVMPRDNIFTRQIARIYAIDPPTNVCPSIHVFNTLAIMIGVHNCSGTRFGRSRFYRISMYTIGVLIILSTVFIKQHSLFDVCFAFVCIMLSYILIYNHDILFSGTDSVIRERIRMRHNF